MANSGSISVIDSQMGGHDLFAHVKQCQHKAYQHCIVIFKQTMENRPWLENAIAKTFPKALIEETDQGKFLQVTLLGDDFECFQKEAQARHIPVDQSMLREGKHAVKALLQKSQRELEKKPHDLMGNLHLLRQMFQIIHTRPDDELGDLISDRYFPALLGVISRFGIVREVEENGVSRYEILNPATGKKPILTEPIKNAIQVEGELGAEIMAMCHASTVMDWRAQQDEKNAEIAKDISALKYPYISFEDIHALRCHMFNALFEMAANNYAFISAMKGPKAAEALLGNTLSR